MSDGLPNEKNYKHSHHYSVYLIELSILFLRQIGINMLRIERVNRGIKEIDMYILIFLEE